MEMNETTNQGAGGTHSLADGASQIKDKAAELSRAAAGKIDQQRETAAGGLEKAADALDRNADRLPGGPRTGDLAHSAAGRLHSTADYLRRNDLNSLWGDFARVVRKNPGPTLLAAAVTGFVVGRAWKSSN